MRRRTALVALTATLVLTLVACDSGGGSEASPSSSSSTTLPACTDAGATTKVVEPKGSTGSGGIVSHASVEPGPVSVLTGIVRTTAAEPVSLDVVATAPSGTVTVPTTKAAPSQEVPLLGLLAETTYAVAVTATTAAGDSDTVNLTFSTGSLPKDLPPTTTKVSTPARMAPGITLFNTMPWGPAPKATCAPVQSKDAGWILGLDAGGEVVWYYKSEIGITDVSPTARGTLLVSMDDVLIREIDMLGNTLSELGTKVATDYVKKTVTGVRFVGPDTERIDIASAHHEVSELPDGNLLTITTAVVKLDPEAARGMCKGVEAQDGTPVPDPTAVVADTIVELTPAGEIVHEWPLRRYFDPISQPGSDMCAIGNPIAPPNWFYPDREGLRDWMHTNAAAVDTTTNTLLVSIRHLDTVIGIRYADDASGKSGDVLWKLSPKGGTLDLTSGDYAYHGHAIEPETGDRILYFDNGNGRPTGEKNGKPLPPYSRAVMYQLDRAAGTATQLWEHRDTTPEGTPENAVFLGDADLLPNGNVLITYGGAGTADGVFYSRFVEVVPDLANGNDTVVFDTTLGDRTTNGFTAYRADRIPSLYFDGLHLPPS
jgi:arylsulfate sulfotransferase